MSEHVLAQPQRANVPQETTNVVGSLQRRDMNQPEPTTLQECLLDTVSGTFAEPRLGFDFSGVPALTGMVRQMQPLLRTQPMVQRFPKDEAAGSAPCPNCPEAASIEVSAPAEPTTETATPTESTEPMTEISGIMSETIPASAEPATESVAPGETTASALIVEDSATDLAPGQMRKSDFLAQLRTEITRAAEEAMAGTGRTTADCPYLRYWFGYYSRQDSIHIERAIHRFAPETTAFTSARNYIPIVAERVRRSVEVWARTGEITGVPEGLSMGLPGMGLLGSVGRLVSGIGSIFFKARDGGPRADGNPQVIQAELGDGTPLDSGVRSRMENAFGMDFARVRAHTDSTAAGLSTRFNARAFTVGRHVAFGAGEYQPGTLIGDALIAHELAHVVQQGDTSASVAPMKVGDAGSEVLEEDADKSAVGAVASIWSGEKETVSGIAENARPRLRSGLRLQRCSVFSELSSQRYQGYDASINPNGLVVPEGGTRDVDYNKKSETMTIASNNTAVATVTETPGIMTVTGVAHGAAMISAVEGTETVEQLDVSVKRPRGYSVDYHYMRDSNDPNHSTRRSRGDEVDLTDTLNLIWERQANIHFETGNVDDPQFDGSGPVLICPSPQCTAIRIDFATSGDYNVFLVREIQAGNSPGGFDDLGVTDMANGITFLQDNTPDNCFTIAHEAGHFLGLYPPPNHPDQGVMSVCGWGIEPQRVFKAEADFVNR